MIVSVVLSVMFGVLFVSLVANAVTTISTSITTAGSITTTGTGALSIAGISTLTGDVTMSGGNQALVITTANDATSTITVGCITMYPTSTASAIHLTFGLTNVGTTTSETAGVNATTGSVMWKFGACPV